MRLFDAHLHIIEPGLPLAGNDGYVPDPFTPADYRTRTADLDVVGGAVVAGSFQGFDTSWVAPALAGLGAGFVAVVNLPGDVADAEVARLDAAGVRAVRVNLFRGGSASLGDLDALARRVHDVAGWHTELYLDAADLPDLEPTLAALPRVCIDHLGMRDDPSGALRRLVAGGAVVKATGLGRIHHDDPGALVRDLLAIDPRSVVAGTDLPSTRARRPFERPDLDAIARWADDLAPAVLVDNARMLYRLTTGPSEPITQGTHNTP